MQKKFLCAAAAAVGLLWGSLGFSYGEMTVAVMAGDLEVNAEAAVVMDADSGRLLYAQNPDKRLANASTGTLQWIPMPSRWKVLPWACSPGTV